MPARPASLRESPDVAAVRAFNRFYTRQLGIFDKYLGSDFSLAEARVLYELRYRETPPAASELTRDLGLDAGYLSRILRGFTRRKLITRETPEHDARRAHLALTARGRKVFDALDRRSSQEVRKLIEELPASRRRSVVDAMHTIQSGFVIPSEAAVIPSEQAVIPSEQAVIPSEARDLHSPFTLRHHGPGDIGTVIQRHGILYSREYGWDERFEALVARICADFIDHFDAKRERCWIAERDGEFLGCIFCVKKSATVAKLRMLLVEPSARGLGVGTRLVEECIRFAREAGYKRMTLWTQSNLHAARHIYQRFGFTLTSEEKHESFGAKLVAQNWYLELQSRAGSRD